MGRRKAAPKKKSASRASGGGGGGNKKDKGGAAGFADGGTTGGEVQEVEVDDEGNVIDPDEPRYCLCNRVSFGTMIQCDNVDVSAFSLFRYTTCELTEIFFSPSQNCKQEWFHLECVGLSDVPARTTKWYCPDCRVLLNIGEKGEVSARGVRT